MTTFRLMIAAVAMASLAACSTTSDKILKPESDATGMGLRAGVAKESIVGFRATDIKVLDGTKELSDIPCLLEGTEFVANFKAPATLNIPSFGKDSKPVRLTCTVDGAKHQKVYPAVNLSAQARKSNAVATGILISPIMGGVMAADAAQERVDDAIGYADIELKI